MRPKPWRLRATLKLVVSWALVSLASFGASQSLTPSEDSAWKAIEPRIGRMVTGGGVVALINSQGYFIAHRSAVSSGAGFSFVRMGSGDLVQVNTIAADDVTQLVLLKSDGWRPNPNLFNTSAYAMRQDKAPTQGSALIAVLPAGPIRAVLSEGDKMGVLPSKRGVTLNEIRFEKPSGNFGGGLVFDLSGRLMGVLGATLDVEKSNNTKTLGGNTAEVAVTSRATSVAGAGGALFGPGQMTVAYSISSDLLARVIEGFLSPSRKPNLPVVGLFCSDSKSGPGAEIMNVTPGSSAEKAGLKVGDVIVRMGDSPINIASEFMRFILRQEIGATISMDVRRGGETKTFEVQVNAGEMR